MSDRSPGLWDEISAETQAQYIVLWKLPDGRICGAHQLMFHWTLHVGVSDTGYDERYCYDTLANLIAGAVGWTGEGDPVGWHKHVPSGRRRHVASGIEWHESEITPREVVEFERRLRSITRVQEDERQASDRLSAEHSAEPSQPTP